MGVKTRTIANNLNTASGAQAIGSIQQVNYTAQTSYTGSGRGSSVVNPLFSANSKGTGGGGGSGNANGGSGGAAGTAFVYLGSGEYGSTQSVTVGTGGNGGTGQPGGSGGNGQVIVQELHS